MSKGKGKKEEVANAWTDSELEELWCGATLQRYKGLGEMNVDQIFGGNHHEPRNPTLIRVTIDDLAACWTPQSLYDKAAPRRQWFRR